MVSTKVSLALGSGSNPKLATDIVYFFFLI